ncbi:hypothetical protein ACLMAL_24430 [Nocardia sp. CWNU-33]|uniref:hypothetical protein n=1 Tax=Nocardia sp. CWNU-33 TaxID=3392117 RepID=UPI00398F2C07
MCGSVVGLGGGDAAEVAIPEPAAVVEWRRLAERFDAAGVAGTAEVISVDGMHISGEAYEVAELTVRISGPGFDTFDADCERGTRDPAWEVGDRFAVVVDPVDLTFAIRS